MLFSILMDATRYSKRQIGDFLDLHEVFNEDTLEAIRSRNESNMNILSKDCPWMFGQPGSSEKKMSGIDSIDLINSGTYLHSEITSRTIDSLSLASIARMMTTLPAFYTGSGAGNITSINGLPIYTIPIGSNLRETILLNYVSLDLDPGEASWHQERFENKELIAVPKLLEGMTLPIRYVILDGKERPEQCIFSTGHYYKNKDGAWRDPWVTYCQGKDGTLRPVSAGYGILSNFCSWRHFAAIFMSDTNIGVISDRSIAREYSEAIKSWKTFYMSNEANPPSVKLREIREDTFVFPVELLTDNRGRIHQIIDVAEKAGVALSKGVYSTCFQDKQKDKQKEKPDYKKVYNLRDQMIKDLWRNCEVKFKEILSDKQLIENPEDFDKLFIDWSEFLKTQMMRIFRKHISGFKKMTQAKADRAMMSHWKNGEYDGN